MSQTLPISRQIWILGGFIHEYSIEQKFKFLEIKFPINILIKIKMEVLINNIGEKEIMENTDKLRNRVLKQHKSIQRILKESCRKSAELKNRIQAQGTDIQINTGLQYYHNAINAILNTYFPLLLDPMFLSLQLESDLEEKLEKLRGTVIRTTESCFQEVAKRKAPQTLVKIQETQKPHQDKASKANIIKISAEKTHMLQMQLLSRFKDPYLSTTEKKEVALKCGLSFNQVNNWFINARERVIKKYMKRQQLSEESLNKVKVPRSDEQYKFGDY